MSGTDVVADDGLVAAHEAVVEAAARGVPAVFGPTPGGGDSEDAPGELPAYDDEDAWAGRTVDGGWLAALLTDDDGRIHRRGLILRGARILGGLDLEGAEISRRVTLVGCQLGEHEINLQDAETRAVRLHRVHCGGIDAGDAHVRGALVLTGTRVQGVVRLVDAQIDASIVCDGARFDAPGQAALNASHVRVTGSVVLRDGFTTTGEVRLSGATVGGHLNLTGAQLHNPESAKARHDDEDSSLIRRFGPAAVTALRANGIDVAGSVSLGHGFAAHGEVQMFSARVGGDMVCAAARFENPGGDALSLDGAHIGGGLFLGGSVTSGQVRLVNGEIGGDLRCRGAHLEHPPGSALYASRATIAGNVFLDEGFVAIGQVRLPAATIGGGLRCSKARISDPGGIALHADAARVGDDVLLDRVTAVGEVRLAGATIGGGLDCTRARIDGAADQVVSIDGVERVIPGGPFPSALDIRGAHIAGSALLRDGFQAKGAVRFTRLTLGGHMDCRGARIVNPRQNALHGSGCQIGGSLVLTDDFVAEGVLRLHGSSIGRDFHAAGATVTADAPADTAIRLVGGRVTGDVVLSEGFNATGTVVLARTTIGGNLDCTGGRFSRPIGRGLDASHTQVNGTVMFDGGTTVDGELHLAGATVGGSLDLDRVRVRVPSGSAGTGIDATNARVTGAVSLGGLITGKVQLQGISVGGDLDLRGAHLKTAGGYVALAADRSHITGGLFLGDGFQAEGEVHFRSCTIGVHASCQGGRFVNPRGTALSLSGSRLAGSVVLMDGFSAEGVTRLGGTTIGGDLHGAGGTFSHPSGTALWLGGAHTTGGVYLDDGFVANGSVWLPAATIDGDLQCAGGRFVNPDGPSLVALGARIAGTLALYDGFHAEGLVVLRGTTVGTLEDDSGSWPDTMDIDGFRYERLVCPPEDRGWRARRQWLRRQSTPSAQGYVHLAAAYRAAGDELDAKRVLIERHNATLRPPAHWRRHLPSGVREMVRRAWRWLLRLTIGHGFAPGRSLLIALPLIVMMALWLTHARSHDMLIPSDETAVTNASGDEPRSSACDDNYPCVQPVVYALDNLIPIIELGQRSRWTPDQSHRGATWIDDGRWLAIATWTTSTLGWILATLVAASFTQIVRRE